MKKKILFLSVFFIISVLNIGLLPANYNRVESEISDPIDLLNRVDKNGTRSFASPISVFQYSDGIELILPSSLGEISVIIYDEANNIVYDETVDSSIQSEIYIDTDFFETGEYSINFINSQGQYLYGNFVIE